MRTAALWGLMVAAVATSVEAEPTAATDLITQPRWVERPSLADYRRLYPPEALATTGWVRLDCRVLSSGRLTDCQVEDERPAGEGFGDRTIELAGLFRMASVDGEGRAVAGRRLRLPVRWDAPPGTN